MATTPAEISAVDPRAYRDMIGRFATGVTVLTLALDGELHAMTANAVTSVSLDPLLILVCIDNTGTLHPQFSVCDSFAVNILAADQQAVSNLFAKSDRQSDLPLSGVAHTLGALGLPIIDGAVAHCECQVHERLAGGDHTIIIGRVVAIGVDNPDAAPLLFYAGRYRALTEG